jgi:hypothetical protein
MNDFLDEINILVRDIVDHNIDLGQTQTCIEALKSKYGEDSFSSINFEKKSLPWDKTYLRELKEKNITGACSEDFLLHMAEVSDYLWAKKRRKVAIAIVVCVVIVLIAILVIIL